MNAFVSFLSEAWLQRLGWVLIHFIWQGTGIALLLAVALRLLTRASSDVRYVVIGGALLICGVIPAVTWEALGPTMERSTPTAPESSHAFAAKNETSQFPRSYAENAGKEMIPRSLIRARTSWQNDLSRRADAALPYLVGFWFGGVWILMMRLTWGWTLMQRMRRSGLPIRDSLCVTRFRRLMDRMRVAVPVRLLESPLVEVPTLIGWLRPAILVPASALIGLSAEQLESILAHELAHVRRCDYLANLFQTIIETVLFYHPAIWWISRQLREERENCCDDMVVEVMQNRLVYVGALARLEEGRAMPLAQSALGGALLQRIKRLAGVHSRKASAWPLWMLVVGILLAPCLAKTEPSAESINQQVLAAVQAGDASALRKLAAQGVDFNAVKGDSPTLLFRAASPEVAEILIEHGADVRACDQSGWTALHSICGRRGPLVAATARVLLEHGADPNAVQRDLGTKPLAVAQDGATVDVLVEHGADVKGIDRQDGLGPFEAAEADVSYYEALIRYGMPFDLKTDGPQLMVHAAFRNNVAVVRWLLEQGVDPNAEGLWFKDKDRAIYDLPLVNAAICGYDKVASFLLDYGAKGENAMRAALRNHNNHMVKLFWESGARNISELCYAISQNAPLEDLEKLLERSVPAELNQDAAMTPLAEAALMGNLKAVQLLTQHGADVNRSGILLRGYPESVTTPLVVAAGEGQDEIVEFLLQHGARPEFFALRSAANTGITAPPYQRLPAKNHFERTVQLLLDAGSLRSVAPELSGDILVAAIWTRCGGGGDPLVVQALLDAGVRPDAPAKSRDGAIKPAIEIVREEYARERSMGGRGEHFKSFLEMLEGAEKGSAPNKPAPPAH